MSLFTSKSTRDKIASIHADAVNHAGIVQNVLAKSQADDSEPSKAIVQSLVRHVATANITAAMLMCIDNDVPLADVRAILNLDVLVDSSDPQAMLDELSSIEHLDFSFEPGDEIAEPEIESKTSDQED